MGYRPAYGELVYGTELYGVTGAIDASATVSASSTTAVNYARVREHAKAISVASVCSPTIERVRVHSPTIALQTAVVQVVEEYAVTDGFRPGYGLKRYGVNLYGRNDSTEDASVSIAATSSATAACERVREHSKIIALQSSTSARGVYSILVNVTVSTQLQTSTAYERIMNHSGSTAASLSLSVPAIEKWEPVSSTPEIWTPVTWSRAA